MSTNFSEELVRSLSSKLDLIIEQNNAFAVLMGSSTNNETYQSEAFSKIQRKSKIVQFFVKTFSKFVSLQLENFGFEFERINLGLKIYLISF